VIKTGSEKLPVLLICCILLVLGCPATGQVAVRHSEGLVHGFLVLRTLEGETLAHGDLTQEAQGNRVNTHLVFHFKDGSLRDETAIYSQLRSFRLLKYHLVQKGPSFAHSEDVSIDVPAARVTVRYTSDDGKQHDDTEQMKLPPDLANGMLFVLLKNLPPKSPEATASMLVTTPKPRIVKLVISAQGEDAFVVGGDQRKATHYQSKIEIGGITGVVAPLLGKRPPDINVWILPGKAPAFVKSTGPVYSGGPVWQIELESPVWPEFTEKK
jgi:hypothetical protein